MAMAKDIERILDDAVVPEMEYEPLRQSDKQRTVTVDDVPEFVLPKTKTEVYLEAKGRLNQKTASVSRAKRGKRTGKTAEPFLDESAAAADEIDDQVWVGAPEDMVPFAWRHPLLSDIERPSKLYRQTVKSDRASSVPALRRDT